MRLGKNNQAKLPLGPIHPFDSSIVNQRSWIYPSGGRTAASYTTLWWLETCFPGRSARPIRREVVPCPNCLTSFTENWWQIACCICSSCNKPKISIRRNHFYNQITSPSVQLMYIHLKLNWYSNSNESNIHLCTKNIFCIVNSTYQNFTHSIILMSLVMIDQYLHVVEQSIYISYMPSKKEIIKELSTFFLYRETFSLQKSYLRKVALSTLVNKL